MRFKPKKSGINFLCDTIILPQYYNFEREASHKTDFENFKEIRFECWNIFISAYFMCAVQTALRSIEDNAHIKLLKGTIGYFNQQYPLFETVLKLFLNTFEPENPFCEEMDLIPLPPMTFIDAFRSSMKYRPIGVSLIDHLLMHP